MHMNSKGHSHEWIRRFFIFLGNKYHIFDTKLNRKFLNVSSDFAYKIKPLNDEDAITKGVEFFYEFILYGILIVVPLYEMNRGQLEAKEKSTAMNSRIKSIEDGVDNIRGEINKESDNLTEKIQGLKSFVDEFEKSLEKTNIQTKNDSEELKGDIYKMIEKTGEMAKEITNNRKELMEKANKLFEQQNGILKLLSEQNEKK